MLAVTQLVDKQYPRVELHAVLHKGNRKMMSKRKRLEANSQHDGTAGGEGRSDLVDSGAEWIVPRGDGADHTDRLPDHPGAKVLVVVGVFQLFGALLVQPLRQTRVEPFYNAKQDPHGRKAITWRSNGERGGEGGHFSVDRGNTHMPDTCEAVF